MPVIDAEIFCQVCQYAKDFCVCPADSEGLSPHSLSVTVYPQSVNGDSGDSHLSPAGGPEASADVPAVTPVTPPGKPKGRHRSAGDKIGNSDWPLSPGIPGNRVTSWTASDLLATEFPDPKWVVPGLIPEGVTLLAGAPKVGKSWLCLGLGTAVASGGKALGSIDVEPGAVLYLALEDTGRRLKNRLTKILGGDPAPSGFTLAIDCPPGLAGMEKISGWLDGRPDARLVIIDVLERIRPSPLPQGMSIYQADYQAIAMIKAVADAHGIGIVVITHVRKGSAEDFLSEISGTLGLSGAADTICALKRARGELDGTLHVTGRDVDENEYALTFAADLAAWQLLGLASEHGLSETRRKILTWLRLHDGSKPAEIAIGTGLSRDLVKQTANRMLESGQLDSDGRGRYFAPPPAEPT